MKTGRLLTLTLALAVAPALLACGDDSVGGLYADLNEADAGYGGNGGGQDPGVTPPDTTEPPVDPPFVPESEDDFRLQPPAASHTFVYVANTDLNSVARINSLTLQIETIEVGLEPTLVRTNLLGDTAVVLNEGSNDISIIYADRDDRVRHVDVSPGANSLLMTPNGDFAIAYYNDDLAEPADTAGSLSDATLVRLRDGAAFNLVVGLHIREIEFDDAGRRAFFVTDDGVAVVNMNRVRSDAFVPPVRVTEDQLTSIEARDREVEVTGDGAYALVRLSSTSTLGLVELDRGQITEIDLGDIPTDLDLLPGGDSVAAVLREIGELAIIPIPQGFDDPSEIVRYPLADEVVGLIRSVPDSQRVVLYSTLNENDHVTLLDLESGDFDTVALRKGIEAVHVSPDGHRLMVLHTKLPGEPVPGTDEYLGRTYAYTVFNLDSETARLVVTETQPGELVFSEDGQHVFLLLADAARDVMAVEWANLTTGRDTTIPLRRLPQAVGIIPATGRIFVSQEHEVGRMAFIDVESGEVREVTGYHLNSRTE